MLLIIKRDPKAGLDTSCVCMKPQSYDKPYPHPVFAVSPDAQHAHITQSPLLILHCNYNWAAERNDVPHLFNNIAHGPFDKTTASWSH